jgi:hypothetical protein
MIDIKKFMSFVFKKAIPSAKAFARVGNFFQFDIDKPVVTSEQEYCL